MKKLLLSLLLLTHAVFAMELSELEYRVWQINQEIAAKEQLLDNFIWQAETAINVLDRSNSEFEPAIQFIEEYVIKKTDKKNEFKKAKTQEIARLVSANIGHIKHQAGLS